MSSKITPYSTTIEIYHSRFHFIKQNMPWKNNEGKTIHVFGQEKSSRYNQTAYYSYWINSLCGMTNFNPKNSKMVEKITFSEYINFCNNQNESLCLSCAKIFNKIINACNDLFMAHKKTTGDDIDLENIEFWQLFNMYREQNELYEKEKSENKSYQKEIEDYQKEIEEKEFRIKELEAKIKSFNDFECKNTDLLEID